MTCVVGFGHQRLDVVSDQAFFVLIKNPQGRGIDGLNHAGCVDRDYRIADRVENRLNALLVRLTPLQFPKLVESDSQPNTNLAEHLQSSFEFSFMGQQVFGREKFEDGVLLVLVADGSRDCGGEPQLCGESGTFTGEFIARIVADDDCILGQAASR